jgi:EAL domain-containing protein (putative c-di-GMP-specific phosphodiesterase class I)
MGNGQVYNCDAHAALLRLAGSTQRYSHILLDQNDTDGLLNEFADLAAETTKPDTNVLVLGAAETTNPLIRFIQTATSRLIVEALMAPPNLPGTPAIDVPELRAALQGAMIETRYQPIIRIADRQPVGVEALVRLNHPKHGQVPPDLFVPQIESAGLSDELTNRVTEIALADFAGPFLSGRGLCMAVNFPLDVLLHEQALDRLEKQRIAAGLSAKDIVVELTESRPVEDFHRLNRSLQRLRDLGYRAAIDDAGPAVPYLEPLLDMPFTCLKLDKVMVQNVLTSESARRFLIKTIEQAKARGLTVIAEGVETDAIWNAIRDMGADQIQGFLAARPLPVTAVPSWWNSWMDQQTASGYGVAVS